jgi:hypothetical protein
MLLFTGAVKLTAHYIKTLNFVRMQPLQQQVPASYSIEQPDRKMPHIKLTLA